MNLYEKPSVSEIIFSNLISKKNKIREKSIKISMLGINGVSDKSVGILTESNVSMQMFISDKKTLHASNIESRLQFLIANSLDNIYMNELRKSATKYNLEKDKISNIDCKYKILLNAIAYAKFRSHFSKMPVNNIKITGKINSNEILVVRKTIQPKYNIYNKSLIVRNIGNQFNISYIFEVGIDVSGLVNSVFLINPI